MNLGQYDFFTNDYRTYEFFSEGPKGLIKKSILFTKMQVNPVIYNLAFGDVDPVTGNISDIVTTDNKDRDIVLATVANTINTFCDHYGSHYVYAKGSTSARTRLYQMSIARLWQEFSIDFEIYGVLNRMVYPFENNVNYDGFLVKRR